MQAYDTSPETPWQRQCREQSSRQAARKIRWRNECKAKDHAARKEARFARQGKRERAYLELLVSDFNYDMNG